MIDTDGVNWAWREIERVVNAIPETVEVRVTVLYPGSGDTPACSVSIDSWIQQWNVATGTGDSLMEATEEMVKDWEQRKQTEERL